VTPVAAGLVGLSPIPIHLLKRRSALALVWEVTPVKAKLLSESATAEKATPLYRLLRLAEVQAISGLKRTQIKAAVRRSEFQKPILLTPGGRAIAWAEEEVLAWREARLASRAA
jgi:predicted DNA-binding transcriptional regulator AlpA